MKEIIKMDFEEWVDKFEPLVIKNGLVLFDLLEDTDYPEMYEPHSDEGMHILDIANKGDRGKDGMGLGNVWTEIDGDDGVYVIEGYHYVNRIGHYVTKHTADPEFFYEVLVEKYERMLG